MNRVIISVILFFLLLVGLALSHLPGETAGPYPEYDHDYYATVDHTRIYQDRPLKPGEVRPVLRIASPRFGCGRPHQKHPDPLAVRTQPHAPVTFNAPDWGAFPNGKRSITVQADEQGHASTTFTYGSMSSFHRIVAHSPEAAGWVVFHLEALSDEAWKRLITQEGGR